MSFPYAANPIQVNPNLGIDPFNQPSTPSQGQNDAGLAFVRRIPNFGVWVNGTDLYCATKSYTDDHGRWFIQVQKSTDGGATWTEMDSGNHPILFRSRGFTSNLEGTTVSFLYQASTNVGLGSQVSAGLTIITFDFTTDTYGTPTAGATGTDNSDINTFDFLPAGGGDYVIVWTQQTGALFQIFKSTYIAAAWSAGTQIATDTTNPTLTGWFFDGTLGHLFYTQRIAFQMAQPSPNPFRHLTIDTSGTASASDVVAADAVNTQMSSPNIFTWPEIDGPGVKLGSVLIAPAHSCGTGALNPAHYYPSVYVYNGSWSGPTLLTTTEEDRLGTDGGFLCALLLDTTAYVFWTADQFSDGGGDPQYKLRFATTTDGVTFSAPQTAYDYTAFPPVGGNVIAPTFLYPSITTDGSTFYVLFTFAYPDNGELPVAFFSVSAAEIPTVTCPLNETATLGIPYVGQVGVSGGTPPYDFTLLTGPAWLIIDHLTGALSGTPTATGSFSFSVEVTDSLDETDTVSCSISVGNPCPQTFRPSFIPGGG